MQMRMQKKINETFDDNIFTSYNLTYQIKYARKINFRAIIILSVLKYGIALFLFYQYSVVLNLKIYFY